MMSAMGDSSDSDRDRSSSASSPSRRVASHSGEDSGEASSDFDIEQFEVRSSSGNGYEGGRSSEVQEQKRTAAANIETDVDFEEEIENTEIESSGQLEKKTEVVEMKADFDDVLGALNDARSAIERAESKLKVKDNAMQDEKNTLKVELDEKRRLLEFTQTWLQQQIEKVHSLEAERDEALSAADNERLLALFARKDVENERKKKEREFDAALSRLHNQKQALEAERDELKREKDGALLAADHERVLTVYALRDAENERKKKERDFDAVLTGLQAQKQALEAERDDLKREKDEKMKLIIEVDVARHAVQQERSMADIRVGLALSEGKKVKEKLICVEGERDRLKCERDAASFSVDELKVKLEKERDAKLGIQTMLTAAECNKNRLENNLMDMREGFAEEKRKLQQIHKAKMKQARRFCRELERDLVQAESNKREFAADLITSTEEKNRLQTAQEMLEKSLNDEKDKSLCQICMESPKDTISLPCLHLHFCFSCLEKHRKRNKSCPTCRTSISGVLRCDICI